jgi:hypothetical protein
MAYIELEAFIDTAEGGRREATSKADVKRAIAADPRTVTFESVGNIFNAPISFSAAAVPVNGDRYSLTISPYVKRSAFGTVDRSRKDGTAVVS